MNRRQFLQAFATIGVAAVLAEKAILQAVSDPVPLLLFGDDRVAWLVDMIMMGTEEASRPASVSLRRAGTELPLFLSGLNAFGGLLRWRPPIDSQIAITREHNARLDADLDGVAVLTFDVPGRGLVPRQYALLREGQPELRRQLLSDVEATRIGWRNCSV